MLFVCKMLVLAIIIMAEIQILRAINVNDMESIPENGDTDVKDTWFINFRVNTGTDRIMVDVINHHLPFNDTISMVEIRGIRISIITLGLILLCQILVSVLFLLLI